MEELSDVRSLELKCTLSSSVKPSEAEPLAVPDCELSQCRTVMRPTAFLDSGATNNVRERTVSISLSSLSAVSHWIKQGSSIPVPFFSANSNVNS
jgi:hypothetical protein